MGQKFIINCLLNIGQISCQEEELGNGIFPVISVQGGDQEISPGISLEGMILKLKLRYFSHLMRKVDSFEKTLMLGGIGGRRRRG